MAARPLPKYRSRHGRCPAGCLPRLRAWSGKKGSAQKSRAMPKMKCAWRSPPTVTGTPELRVRRKKARKDAWSDTTTSARRTIPDIGAEKGHVVTFHFHPMHGNMVRGGHRLLRAQRTKQIHDKGQYSTSAQNSQLWQDGKDPKTEEEVGVHTILPRSSNETCPAFVWRTNRA